MIKTTAGFIIKAMRIVVNDNEMIISEGTSLMGLLDTLGLSSARVAVELNRAIIKKDSYESTVLSDGDMLEILSFVGGG